MCKAIDEMIEDGRNEGENSGKKKEKLRIAKELKGLLSDEVIAEKTELPLEVIKNLHSTQRRL